MRTVGIDFSVQPRHTDPSPRAPRPGDWIHLPEVSLEALAG
jgi:hypothetical protein